MGGAKLLKAGYTVKGDVVVLPIGSLENHGVLPLGSDTIIAECVTARAAEYAECGLLIAPTIPYSVSIEHSNPRVSVAASLFIEYLAQVIENFLEWSPGVLVAVFHGGAFPAAYLAARSLRARGQRVAVFNAWSTVAQYLGDKYGVRARIIHADPVEASILYACGHDIGIEEAGLHSVLKNLTSHVEPRLSPWTHLDIDDLYPDTPVLASRELGDELVAVLAKELAEHACSLARRDS